jgi:alkylation response protein AidB-like acyl-CoA dehydrogenase
MSVIISPQANDGSVAEDVVAVRESVRRFIDAEIAPHYADWERIGHMPRDLWRKMGAAGLLCAAIPEQYGGGGADMRVAFAIVEEFTRSLYALPGFYTHSEVIVPYILHYGTDAQKRHWLPRCASGEIVTSIAMTEPDAGSDLKGTRTTARSDGDEFVIDGQKTFITNGFHADLVIVLATTQSAAGKTGKSLFLIEADRPGFGRGRILDKVGQRAQDTTELFFEGVRIPADNLLGELGKGLSYLMTQLPRERLAVGVSAIAGAETVLERTLDYARQRKAFGQPIGEFQHLRFKLAELKTSVTVARAFLEQCIRRFEAGHLPADEAAMCKYWLTDVEASVVDQCVQMHGGNGYMREYPVARAYADARGQRIYAGTNEIMKEIIARAM